MTRQDDRERARIEAWNKYDTAEYFSGEADEAHHHGFDAGASWQKREDEQRIAALVVALRELVTQVERSNAMDDHGHPLANLQALEDGRRALAGSEE